MQAGSGSRRRPSLPTEATFLLCPPTASRLWGFCSCEGATPSDQDLMTSFNLDIPPPPPGLSPNPVTLEYGLEHVSWRDTVQPTADSYRSRARRRDPEHLVLEGTFPRGPPRPPVSSQVSPGPTLSLQNARGSFLPQLRLRGLGARSGGRAIRGRGGGAIPGCRGGPALGVGAGHAGTARVRVRRKAGQVCRTTWKHALVSGRGIASLVKVRIKTRSVKYCGAHLFILEASE